MKNLITKLTNKVKAFCGIPRPGQLCLLKPRFKHHLYPILHFWEGNEDKTAEMFFQAIEETKSLSDDDKTYSYNWPDVESDQNLSDFPVVCLDCFRVYPLYFVLKLLITHAGKATICFVLVDRLDVKFEFP